MRKKIKPAKSAGTAQPKAHAQSAIADDQPALIIARILASGAAKPGTVEARLSFAMTEVCSVIGGSSMALTEVFCDAKDKTAFHFVPLCAGGFWSARQIEISNEQLSGVHGKDLLTLRLFEKAWDIPQPTAHLRRELIDDRAWYASDTFKRTRVPCSVDDAIYCLLGDPGGRRFGLGVHRARNKGYFTNDHRTVVLAFIKSIPPLIEGLFPHRTGLESLLLKLPPRRRQVMDALIEGLSEKQIASRLSLSVHSVHQHIRLLHRALGVNSRGELLSLVLGNQQDTRLSSPFVPVPRKQKLS